jgi:hypothetical protein
MEHLMRDKISAVHAAEVQLLFERLGLGEQLRAGEIRCAVCGSPITADTFKSAWRNQGALLFFCENPGCEPDELSDSPATHDPASHHEIG